MLCTQMKRLDFQIARLTSPRAKPLPPYVGSGLLMTDKGGRMTALCINLGAPSALGVS